MMTTRDPALIWNPLSEAHSQAPIVPWQWIVHTAVDAPGPTDLHGYFENHTNLESHTWLRWDRHEQLMSFRRRADANYRANHFWYDGAYRGAVSTETEDDRNPEQNPWNDYQLDELIRFGYWLHCTYGIPVRLCRHPKDSGMGWHSMFPGVWTPYKGKTCPGATRIHQFKTIVLPGIQALVDGKTQQEKFDDMYGTEIIASYGEAEYDLTNPKVWQDIRFWTHVIYQKPEKERRGGIQAIRMELGLPKD